MFTPALYRAKAAKCSDLAKTANSSDEVRELRRRAQSFTVLADNEQWLADHHDQTVHTDGLGRPDEVLPISIDETTLAAEEEHVLRCLGAALIMQWNTLPAKLRRELFDTAGSMGALLDAAPTRGKVARFLHRHRDDEPTSADGLESMKFEAIPTVKLRSDETHPESEIARWNDDGGGKQTGLEPAALTHASHTGEAAQ